MSTQGHFLGRDEDASLFVGVIAILDLSTSTIAGCIIAARPTPLLIKTNCEIWHGPGRGLLARAEIAKAKYSRYYLESTRNA